MFSFFSSVGSLEEPSRRREPSFMKKRKKRYRRGKKSTAGASLFVEPVQRPCDELMSRTRREKKRRKKWSPRRRQTRRRPVDTRENFELTHRLLLRSSSSQYREERETAKRRADKPERAGGADPPSRGRRRITPFPVRETDYQANRRECDPVRLKVNLCYRRHHVSRSPARKQIEVKI